MRLDHITPLLQTLIADDRVVGMTVVEATPTTTPTEARCAGSSLHWVSPPGGLAGSRDLFSRAETPPCKAT